MSAGALALALVICFDGLAKSAGKANNGVLMMLWMLRLSLEICV
jgi:hypothetical protein